MAFHTMKLYHKWKGAFTLIELLVVISIIAILVSLLLISISKAKESGRRTRCIANERNIGIANQLFIDDNNDFLPNTAYESCNSSKLLWVSGYLNHYICGTDSTNILRLIDNKYSQLSGYITDPKIYKCPSDRKIYDIIISPREDYETIPPVIKSGKIRSYSMNWHLGWMDENYGRQPDKYFTKINEINNPSRIFNIIDVNSDSICWDFFGITYNSIFMFPAIYHNNASTISYLDGHIINKRWKTAVILKPRPTEQAFHGHSEPALDNIDLKWLMDNALE